MARTSVNELIDGEQVDEVFLLADRQLRANRNADLYLLAQLRDRTGQISGLLWNITEESVAHIQAGQLVRAKGKVQLFQGNLQVILTKVDPLPNTGYDPEEFTPATNRDTEKLRMRMHELLLAIPILELRTVAEEFLNDQELMNGFARAPAGVRLHHAYHGGLIEHVVSLMEIVVKIADLYPKVDKDLLMLGAFLHDIGKVRELSYETTFGYTDEGQLLGHLSIGVEMLESKIKCAEQRLGYEFPEDLTLRIKHMILSHHGSYEFGSPRLPMTLEAIVLHCIDTLDAKVNEAAALIESDPNSTSNWTPFHQALQRKLYKGGG